MENSYGSALLGFTALLHWHRRNDTYTSMLVNSPEKYKKMDHQGVFLRQIAVLKNQENLPCLRPRKIDYSRPTREIYKVLLSQWISEVWNQTSKTVRNKWNVIWNEEPLNICNGRKAQQELIRPVWEYFPNRWHRDCVRGSWPLHLDFHHPCLFIKHKYICSRGNRFNKKM